MSMEAAIVNCLDTHCVGNYKIYSVLLTSHLL